MSNIEKTKTFEEVISERLRNDIGQLMPEEQLSKLVAKSIEDNFFKPRTTRVDYKDVHRPSIFVELVSELLEKEINIVIGKWLIANRELLASKLLTITESKMEELVLRALTRQFNEPFDAFRNNLNAQLMREGKTTVY